MAYGNSTKDTTEGQSWETVIAVLEVIIYIVGTLGNAFVIFMILYLKKMKKSTHWLILQLAFADLLYLQTIPLRLSISLNPGQCTSLIGCKIVQTLQYFNLYASVLFLTILSIDRLLAVSYRTTVLTRKLRRVKVYIAIAVASWLASLVICTPVIIYSNNAECACAIIFLSNSELQALKKSSYDDYDGESSSPLNDYYDELVHSDEEIGNIHSIRPSFQAFNYFNLSVMYILPFLVLSFCYGRIVLELNKSSTRMRKHSETPSEGGSSGASVAPTCNNNVSAKKNRHAASKQKVRVTATCAALVVLFMVCWLPYHTIVLAQMTGLLSKKNIGVLTAIYRLFLTLNSALNPYLYNFIGTFKQRLKEIRQNWSLKTPSTPTGSTKAKSGSSISSAEIKAKDANKFQLNKYATEIPMNSLSNVQSVKNSE